MTESKKNPTVKISVTSVTYSLGLFDNHYDPAGGKSKTIPNLVQPIQKILQDAAQGRAHEVGANPIYLGDEQFPDVWAMSKLQRAQLKMDVQSKIGHYQHALQKQNEKLKQETARSEKEELEALRNFKQQQEQQAQNDL